MTTFKQFLIEQPSTFAQSAQLQSKPHGRRQKAKFGTMQKEPQIKQQAVSVAKQIVRDCKPYLYEHEKFAESPLFRGSNRKQEKSIIKRRIRAQRRPKDTTIVLHKAMDAWFEQNFRIPFRSSAVFATGDWVQAEEYGHPFVIFPIGQFRYVWSPRAEDLYGEMETKVADAIWDSHEKTKRPGSTLSDVPPEARRLIELATNKGYTREEPATKEEQQQINQIAAQQMEKLNITDQDLSRAVQSGNEIMIAGQQYYTIPADWYRSNNIGQLVRAVLEGDVEKYI